MILPSGKIIEYETDIYDRRVAKKVNGVIVKRFIYEDSLNISQELDADNNILVKYIYGIKENIPEYLIKNNKKYRTISDHLGSPVMIVDSSNNVVKEIKYDTFGNVISDSAPAFEIPFRFAGGIYDEDTRLIRFGVRDYDPEVGRWTSKEPLGFAGSRNWYVYSKNNPVNYWDITGYKPGDPFPTADAAAKDAMVSIHAESNYLGVEMGGGIYMDAGAFYATDPKIGFSDEVNMPDIECIGYYHSHIVYSEDALNFSSGEDYDLGLANYYDLEGYLVNVDGDMIKYDIDDSKTKKIGNVNNEEGNPDSFYERDVVGDYYGISITGGK